MDPETRAHLRDQGTCPSVSIAGICILTIILLESSYADLVASTESIPPSFLFFLASRFTTTSPQATFDRVRLKAILFLNNSPNYDVAAAKKELDEMEVRGFRGLTLERAIVYGKVRQLPTNFLPTSSCLTSLLH